MQRVASLSHTFISLSTRLGISSALVPCQCPLKGLLFLSLLPLCSLPCPLVPRNALWVSLPQGKPSPRQIQVHLTKATGVACYRLVSACHSVSDGLAYGVGYGVGRSITGDERFGDLVRKADHSPPAFYGHALADPKRRKGECEKWIGKKAFASLSHVFSFFLSYFLSIHINVGLIHIKKSNHNYTKSQTHTL